MGLLYNIHFVDLQKWGRVHSEKKKIGGRAAATRGVHQIMQAGTLLGHNHFPTFNKASMDQIRDAAERRDWAAVKSGVVTERPSSPVFTRTQARFVCCPPDPLPHTKTFTHVPLYPTLLSFTPRANEMGSSVVDLHTIRSTPPFRACLFVCIRLSARSNSLSYVPAASETKAPRRWRRGLRWVFAILLSDSKSCFRLVFFCVDHFTKQKADRSKHNQYRNLPSGNPLVQCI